METIKPTKINVTNNEGKLTSAEQGKLWATYVGNTMSQCVLSYMLNHVDDEEIKKLLENAIGLSNEFVQTITEIYEQENYPIPRGFTKDDVNVGAPRLFADEFYPHYLKYVGKAGISLYAIAIPLVTRSDVRAFYTQCIDLTVKLMNQINEILIRKGLLTKPSYIPYPDRVDFIKEQSYLNGFFGDVRPLQALEITHLYDNIENNATSKAVLLGFSQITKTDQTRKYFLRGKEIAEKHYNIFSQLLQQEDLSAPPMLDPLVTTSTFAPFSDKLMMFHKLDMFAVRIRAYGNALSMSARLDVAEKFGRLLLEVGKYVEDGATILIDHGWMEQPPQAADRKDLASK
ncbi:DUF3231 family protein [Paenibacillus allorhizosphaerae]|uniref:DUF3231 family protein n=1 Tax=Paenibacillus allorhizosphaerae TaxID=2849866 RepID=A0ABM8V9N4_9BACL|nr:DUF3231 family protein [Paenibacillus allorhizosphaerae]CAG7613789.1 hypothetical protein PAECIP111802_00013 [Paenibacillus allorhizosphaerae]